MRSAFRAHLSKTSSFADLIQTSVESTEPDHSNENGMSSAEDETAPTLLPTWRTGRDLSQLTIDMDVGQDRTLKVLQIKPTNPSAATLIFVHGSMGSMAQYFPLARHIHDSTGSGIVAYDQYGCGQSPKPESWESYNFGRLADDLAAVFEWTRSRDWHNRRQIVVVAHSYGTHLALRLALDLRAERSPDSCPGNGGARNSSKKRRLSEEYQA